MNLFTPQEARTATQTQFVNDIERAKQLRTLVERYEVRLQESEKSFDALLVSQRETWAAESKKHAEEVESSRKILAELLERRRIATIPLTKEQESLDNKKRELDEKEESLNTKEYDNEATLRAISVQQDELSLRTKEIERSTESLSLRQKGIDTQSRITAQGAKQLSQALTDFITEKDTWSAQKATQEAILTGRDIVLTEREKRASAHEADLVSRETRLLDRAQELERAAKEIKAKST